MQSRECLLTQFYRTKHLELKYYLEVSWNCTNTGAVILLNNCVLASGSYLPKKKKKKVAGYFES